MGFPKALVQQWQSNARAARTGAAAPPAKVRKRVGTGDWARRKAWVCERQCEPGVFISLRIHSPQNLRENRWDRAARCKVERNFGWVAGVQLRKKMALPVTVTFTRYGVNLLDSDGCVAGFKAVRDGISDAFGCDDSDNGKITWVYAPQVKAPKGCYGIRISITPAALAPARAVGGAVWPQ